MVKAARDNECSIRIGVNAGSLEKDILEKFKEPCPEALVESALRNIRILEDEGDGTYHTALLGRHSTQVLQIRVKPSDDRSDSDLGLIHLEVTSEGNSTKKSTVQFTIQRTFGIQATPIFDCDGAPLGTVNKTACVQNGMSMRLMVTNSLQEGSTSTPWRLIDPAELQRNLDVDEMYSQWVFRITDDSGDSVP